MSLDGNDGSDMELDSDTSLERYYSHSSTVATYSQYSKPPNSSNTDDNKDGLSKLLDHGKKKNVSASHSPQIENDSSQFSNNKSDYINEFDNKSLVNSNTSPQPLSLRGSQCPHPENTINVLPQPLSPSSISEITSAQVTLALNSTSQSQQLMSGFSDRKSVV